MSKQTIQYVIIGAGILSLFIPIFLFSGCGTSRPGQHYGLDHDSGDRNTDWRKPEMFEKKMEHLTHLVRGPDANKARRSADTLGDMGAAAEGALDDLKEFEDHPVERTREAIQRAIQKIEDDIAKKNSGS